MEGPISYDLAMDPQAAEIEGGIKARWRGDADLLVVPDLVSGNIAAKTITVLGGGRTGGVVMGAQVPVLLVSRAATADDNYMSHCGRRTGVRTLPAFALGRNSNALAKAGFYLHRQ